MEEMNVVAPEEQVEKKYSYEELENIVRNLDNRCAFLTQKLNEMQMDNAFKRLDYLFKVVENESRFPGEFVKKCVEEIVHIMTIPEESTETTEE